MWARNIALALTLASVGADTSSFDIVEAGRVYQQGSYPYLPGYAGLAVNSRQECEKACRDTPECQFGTYVTKDADTTDGYNYQKQAKAGECWLSAQTHSTPTPCGVPCVGFRKTTTCLRIPLDAKYCTYYNGLKFSNHWWILRSTYLEHEAVLQDGAKVRFESKSTGAVTGYATIKTHAKYGKDQEQCARLDQCGGQRPQVCVDKFGANNENAMDLGFMFVDQSESPGFRMEMSVGDYMLVGECNTKDVPTDVCPKDVKTCWNGKALGRISATTCKTLGVADDVCAANACQFGEIIGTDQIRWGCEKREECTCDPSLHPSHFNTCHQDPWSRHIVVTHLPRRFHAKTFEEGAQHRCAMVGGGENPVCQCCTCMRGTHRLSDGFLDLGRESHPVLPDSARFETKEAASFKDCEAQCGDDCKWGSFIARKDAKGSCVISFSDAVKTADHKLKTVRCPPTTDKCHSFLHSGLEADAVDAGNSKAFIRKSVDADGKHTISNPTGRQAKQDFEQCLWKNNKCEANDRSGHPGLTGVHKTIPGATETWCDSQGAAGHNMVWRKTSKQCDYGCHIIEDEAQCALAEDHFKIVQGAKPCSPGQLWNTAKEACNTCADATYQWPAAHFIDRCFQCPYAKGSTKFKDLTEGQDLCKGDCITRSTTCSDKAKCGTLVSPELEAFCKANPDSCTTDDVAAASCQAECLVQCMACALASEAEISHAQSTAQGDDVFMKGAYLEVGMHDDGYYGTHSDPPPGFVSFEHRNYGGLSLLADHHKDGWDKTKNRLNFQGDIAMPGSPHESWVLGYYKNGQRIVETVGRAYSGYYSRDSHNFNCKIIDESRETAGALKATSKCENGDVEVTQTASFGAGQLILRTEVQVRALISGITEVRYMRNVDPDQDVDAIHNRRRNEQFTPEKSSKYGWSSAYTTQNKIVAQYANGDGYSAVASSSNFGTDAYLALFSRDSRSYVRWGGFHNRDPYTAEFDRYATTYKAGAEMVADEAIDVMVKLGSLANGESASTDFYYVMDKTLEDKLDEALKPTCMA